jgi:hypothetical protein
MQERERWNLAAREAASKVNEGRYRRGDDLGGSMAKRKLTEFEKLQIIRARKVEHGRQFLRTEIDVTVEDDTDEQGNPRVTERPKS